MAGTDLGLAATALGDVLTGTSPILSVACLGAGVVKNSHAAVEVHAVDTNTGVVLDTQVNVLGDTEAEVAGLGEVALLQFVLLDLEATLEDLLSLGTTDGNVDGDLFVTTDTEGTDGVTGLAYPAIHISLSIPANLSNSDRLTVDGGLTAKLLKHLGRASEPITRLADTDVEDELLDAQLAHGVCVPVLSFRLTYR